MDAQQAAPEDQLRAFLLQEVPGIDAPGVGVPHGGLEHRQRQEPARRQSEHAGLRVAESIAQPAIGCKCVQPIGIGSWAGKEVPK